MSFRNRTIGIRTNVTIILLCTFTAVLSGCGGGGGSSIIPSSTATTDTAAVGDLVVRLAYHVPGATAKRTALATIPDDAVTFEIHVLGAQGQDVVPTTQATRATGVTSQDVTISGVPRGSYTLLVVMRDAAGQTLGFDTSSAVVSGTTALITVETAADLTSLAVTPDGVTLTAGQSQAFTAVASFSDNTAVNVTTLVTWSSDSPNVASIDAAGVATALNPGTTNLHAIYNDLTTPVAMTVGNGPAPSPTPTPSPTPLPFSWARTLLFGAGATKSTIGTDIVTNDADEVFVSGHTTGALYGNTIQSNQDLFVSKYDRFGARQWTCELGTSGPVGTAAYSIALDYNGNVFVVGATSGGLDGNVKTGDYDYFVTKLDASGTRQWTRQMGIAASETVAYGVATDSNGNVLIAGYTQGDLDGNPRVGTSDMFIAKYDGSGAKQWTRLLGVSGAETRASAVAVDGSGNAFVTGHTVGGLEGGSLRGTQDYFIAKFDSLGVTQWVRQGGTASQVTGGTGVALDAGGNPHVTGYGSGSLDDATQVGDIDLFIVKFDGAGTRQWTRQAGSFGSVCRPADIRFDRDGNMLVGGFIVGAFAGYVKAGEADGFVMKLDATGSPTWTRQFGAVSSEVVASTAARTETVGIAADTSGHVLVTGFTSGNFEGNPLSGLEAADCFIVGFDALGVKAVPSPTPSTAWVGSIVDGAPRGFTAKATESYAVTTDGAGNVYITGYTTGNLHGNTLMGYRDAFVTKYDHVGTRLWTRQLGLASTSTSSGAIAVDGSGNVYISGTTSGALGGHSLTGVGTDAFAAKLDPTGNVTWVTHYGVASASSAATALALDPNGNVCIAGIVNLGSRMDGFVASLSGVGVVSWSQLISAGTETQVHGLATDSSGNLVVAGLTDGDLDGNTVSVAGNVDLFVKKLSSAGQAQWTRQVGVTGGYSAGTVGYTKASAVVTDGTGNIYVGGTTNGNLDGHAISRQGGNDFFVMKYDSTGTKDWSVQKGALCTGLNGPTSAFTSLEGLALDGSNNIVVAACTNGKLDDISVWYPTGSHWNFSVLKFDNGGTQQWSLEVSSRSATLNPTGCATEASGNVFLTGSVNGNYDDKLISSAGAMNYFITKFDAAGVKQ